MENGRINTLSGALRYYRLVAGAENKSPQTIIWVGTAGKQLQEFLGEDILLKDLNASHLRNFIGFLKGRGRYLTHPCRRPSEKGLSAETLNAYVRALRAFSTFLNREGVIETNVFAVVKPPKVPRRQLVPLSESQLKRLLALPGRSTYNGFLDHILICFLLDTLARVNEVVTLEVENIDLEQGYAKVMCKGSKENILPFSPRLVALMARYVSRYRPDSGSPYVFLTKNGRRLTANMIEKRLRAYGVSGHPKGARAGQVKKGHLR